MAGSASWSVRDAFSRAFSTPIAFGPQARADGSDGTPVSGARSSLGAGGPFAKASSTSSFKRFFSTPMAAPSSSQSSGSWSQLVPEAALEGDVDGAFAERLGQDGAAGSDDDPDDDNLSDEEDDEVDSNVQPGRCDSEQGL